MNAIPDFTPDARAHFIEGLKDNGVTLVFNGEGDVIGYEDDTPDMGKYVTPTGAVRFPYSPPTLTLAVPYGFEIAPELLNPEWLKAGDTHLIRTKNPRATTAPHYRLAALSVNEKGVLMDGHKPLHLAYIDFMVLYPAPVFHNHLSPHGVCA